MISKERYDKLCELKEFLAIGRYVFKEVGKFELYFFKKDSSGGCECNKAGIVTKLRRELKLNEGTMKNYMEGSGI
tara:strand:- start:518 stop:742 length:225 start_codon:yes stop_codon:yes gene_type:complete